MQQAKRGAGDGPWRQRLSMRPFGPLLLLPLLFHRTLWWRIAVLCVAVSQWLAVLAPLVVCARVWEEKLRVKGGRGFTVGVSETRYEPIWERECLPSPALCLTYSADTAQLLAGHGDGEIHVRGDDNVGACVCGVVISWTANNLGCHFSRRL